MEFGDVNHRLWGYNGSASDPVRGFGAGAGVGIPVGEGEDTLRYPFSLASLEEPHAGPSADAATTTIRLELGRSSRLLYDASSPPPPPPPRGVGGSGTAPAGKRRRRVDMKSARRIRRSFAQSHRLAVARSQAPPIEAGGVSRRRPRLAPRHWTGDEAETATRTGRRSLAPIIRTTPPSSRTEL